MVAFDQNSSMIEMAQKALKGKGHDREPTYEEIVEAKLDMMRQMAPAASGVLIDAYYGAWPAIATEAMPPDKGMLVRVEKSGSAQEQGRRPDGRDRAGLVGREDQADGRRRRQAPRPVRAGRAGLGRAPVRADPARLQRVPEVRHPASCSSRSPSPTTARRRPTSRTSTARPRRPSRPPARSAGSATSTRPSSPARSATSPTTSSSTTSTPSPRPASAPGSCSRPASITPTTSSRSRWRWSPAARASWAAGPSGRNTSSRTAPRPGPSSPPTDGLKRVADVDAVVQEQRHPLVRPVRPDQGRPHHHPGRRGLAHPLRPPRRAPPAAPAATSSGRARSTEPARTRGRGLRTAPSVRRSESPALRSAFDLVDRSGSRGPASDVTRCGLADRLASARRVSARR